MKAKHLLTILGIAAMCMVSCKKPEALDVNATITLDENELLVETNQAGTDMVALSTTASKVTATSDAAWLQATASTRALTLKYAANPDQAQREATVTVKAGKATDEIVVIQKGEGPIIKHYKVGDVVDRKNGIIYWVDPNDDTKAKAVSAKRNTLGVWGPDQLKNGFSYVNGKANSDLVPDNAEFNANYFCKHYGTGGWYLASCYELLDIFTAYNGVAWDSPNFVAAQPKDLTSAEQIARRTFDSYILKVGGDVLNAAAEDNNGESYFSSTEVSATHTYFVRFGSLEYSPIKKSGSRYARCVKVYGDYTYPTEPIMFKSGAATVALGAAANSKETITYTVDYAASLAASSDAGWCTVAVADGSTAGTYDVTFTATSANETTSERTCKVPLTATNAQNDTKTFEVTVSQPVYVADGFNVGDIYKENDVAVGVVFWVDSNNPKRAKIVSLTRSASGLTWATGNALTTSLGCSSKTDGAANTSKMRTASEAAVTASGAEAKFPPIAFLDGLTGTGWYIPALDELTDLFIAYNGKTTIDQCTQNAQPAADSDEGKARAAFDGKLTANHPLNGTSGNGDGYLSSTEYSDTQAAGFRFGKYGYNMDWSKNNSNTSRYYRAIKVVTKD